MKKCTRCKEPKALNDFYTDKRTKDGRQTVCKTCIKSKYELVCEYCDKKFNSQNGKARFCSVKCRNEQRKEEHAVYFQCELCGKELKRVRSEYNKSKNHFCVGCFQEGIKKFKLNSKDHLKNRVTFECDACGKEKEVPESHYKGHDRHYCSDKCQRLGLTMYWSGENSPQYDPTIDEEVRERRRYGKNSYRWRNSVYERDGYTCQCCGDASGGNLNAHHLNSYDWSEKDRSSTENGITLCEICHKEFHSLYGYGKNTRKQFEEFIFIINNKRHANTEVN